MKLLLSLGFISWALVSVTAKAQNVNGCDVDAREVASALLQSTDELTELKVKGFETTFDVTCVRGVTGFKSYTLTFANFDSPQRAALTVGLNLRPGRARSEPLVYAKRLTYPTR